MRNVKKILVPTDFSPPAARALEEAVATARAFGASITLFHVYGLPTPMPDSQVAYDGDLMASLDATAERKLADARDELRARVADSPAIAIKAVLGFAADEIVAEVQRGHFDLIVMGTHGRTGLKHMLLGSVAEQVVRKSTVPVLTVHPTAGGRA
jgi:nucleotide-binding universal stress UspA family protein